MHCCLPFSLLLSVLLHPSFSAVFASTSPNSEFTQSSPLSKRTFAKREYTTHDYYVLELANSPNPLRSSSPLLPVLDRLLSLDKVSEMLGVQIIEPAGELEGHWLVRAEKMTLGERDLIERDLVLDTFQRLKARARADGLQRRTSHISVRQFDSSVKSLVRQVPRQRAKRAPIDVRQDVDSAARVVASRLGIQDPLFPDQWHLINDEFPQHMMNVTGIWEELGLTGKGVISSLVDDGLDYESEDLKANFDALNSYDFNTHVELPTPSLPADHHGTRCAGQIAASKNNVCGIGIAYESRVAGVRILSGPISDVDEAAALNYGYNRTENGVDIYSCSWGPPDDGKSMEGPSPLITKAFINGINRGRGGKGSIFVFASGNGAANGDQCNFDGYTNAIYSVTVSAVDYKGLHPYYSEPCAANLIVAYSSGSGKHIVTTDRGKNECATTHGGTSAAAPNVVGVIALALQANPNLNWRDVQYISIETAKMINEDDQDWEETSSGRMYSYKYGYGAIDGWAFVQKAKDWKSVGPQAWFHTHSVQLENGTFNATGNFSEGALIPPSTEGIKSTLDITADMLLSSNLDQNKLEHIQVRVWIQHAKRGDVEVEIVSPHGVKSVLGAKRVKDVNKDGYPGWIFMSVKHWGENPIGTWTIRVSDQSVSNPQSNGSFIGWSMILWGTALDASKARLYELPTYEKDSDGWVFPPVEDSRPDDGSEVPSTTRLPTRPTEHLPGDHGTAEGEANKPAFGGSSNSTSVPTADEGYFTDLSKLSSNQKWFGGAIAIVVLFGLSAAVYFWQRRRAIRRRAAYESLAGNDEMPMTSMMEPSALMSGRGRGGRNSTTAGGGVPRSGRTRELYDAFGEVSDSDEDEDVNERTRLHPSGQGDGRMGDNVVGFHSGFLDDEDAVSPIGSAINLSSGARAAEGGYRDEP
ncbi:peptidase S8/S53 domain-containing protein [Lentinula aciculospora]|uniref:Peptidase S8/S53 domain-containing protein n=1 Tax=Lentinula aciculospora TaxID=153920 RepID=A0A9W9A6J3_9AGAR|nr:peptidase S8/S53 domain-containing protein [Lentinula aciculospora]